MRFPVEMPLAALLTLPLTSEVCARQGAGTADAPQGFAPAVLIDTAKMDASTVELLTELADAVRAEPANGTRHADLGLAYEANTIWALAETQYDHAIALLPDKPEWVYRRGLLRTYNGDFDGAVADLADAASRLRNTAVVQARYGDVLRTLGRLEEAEAAWTQAIASEAVQQQPIQWAASRTGLAQTLLDLGEFERALQYADEALAIDPTSKYARYTRGLALRELGREDEARDELVRGLDGAPEFPLDPHWQRLAEYGRGYNRRMMGIENMLRAGDLAGGGAALQAMLEERPDDHFVLNLAARAALMSGDRNSAKFLLDKSLAASPDAANTYIEYTILLVGEMAELQQQAAALAGQPGAEEAQARLAALDTEARTKISRALELTPQLGRAHYYAGLIQLQTAGQDQQKLQGAMQSMQNALRLGCTEPRFYQHLAQVYALTGRPREMVRYAELAAANAPDSIDALSFLVQAYASGGRQADLGGVAKRLVAAGPNNPDALRMAILAYNTVADLDGAEAALALLEPLTAQRPDLAQFVQQVRAHLAAQRAQQGNADGGAPKEGGR
ncbi:MAG: tetratricopeptide repeat protein [Planctomycetota bacterium]